MCDSAMELKLQGNLHRNSHDSHLECDKRGSRVPPNPHRPKYSSKSASANVLNKHKTSFIANFQTVPVSVRRLQRRHIQTENYVNHSAGRFSEQNATRPETEWNSISVCKSRPRQGSHPGEHSDRDSRVSSWHNFCSPLRNTSQTSSTRRRDYSASMDFSGRIAPLARVMHSRCANRYVLMSQPRFLSATWNFVLSFAKLTTFAVKSGESI